MAEKLNKMIKNMTEEWK